MTVDVNSAGMGERDTKHNEEAAPDFGVQRGGPTVAEYLGGLPLTKFHVAIFLICALVALMDGYDSAVVGMTATSIAATLNLDVRNFGPVFAAAQFGFMTGAFLGGLIADRKGRKQTLVVATLFFGAGTVVTSFSGGLLDLIAYRFLTGVGLGAAAACFVSLCSEYAPERARGLIVAGLWALVPTGNIVAGVLSSIILPRGGWKTIYIIGGAIPLVAALLILLVVPESVRFLSNDEDGHARARRILVRLSAGTKVPAEFSGRPDKTVTRPVAYLFAPGTIATTLGLWVGFFCVWFILITTIAWISPFLQQEGISAAQASLVVASDSSGGVLGIIAVGRLIDLYDKYLVNIATLLAGTCAAVTFALAPASFATAMGFCFLMGLTVGGASGGLTALAAMAYPVSIRSTGVGWAMGMARLGAAVGPLLGGTIMRHNGGRTEFLYVLAVFAAIASFALLALRRLQTPYAHE